MDSIPEYSTWKILIIVVEGISKKQSVFEVEEEKTFLHPQDSFGWSNNQIYTTLLLRRENSKILYVWESHIHESQRPAQVSKVQEQKRSMGMQGILS